MQKFLVQHEQNQQEAQRGLAQEVLAEIPGQVCQQLKQAARGSTDSPSRTVSSPAKEIGGFCAKLIRCLLLKCL